MLENLVCMEVAKVLGQYDLGLYNGLPITLLDWLTYIEMIQAFGG
jgi:hypothetical protein